MGTRIERLYGVFHGASAVSILGDAREIFIEPSTYLQEELRQLPPGTRVGIEYHPDIIQGNSISDDIEFSPSGIHYWQQIEALCKEKGLPVVYLDDVGLVLEASRHYWEAQELNYLAEQMQSFTDEVGDDHLSRAKERLREAYAHLIISYYTIEVLREEKLLETIDNQKPEVVILGKAHGDILMLRPELLETRGIEVARYQTEIIDEELSVFPSVALDAGEVLERTLLIRSYYAVTQCRIDPERQPDYIGYCQESESIPEVGLFEMYVKKTGEFAGTIIDLLGDATMEGIITDQGVEFVKKYDPEQSVPNAAAAGEITYVGEMSGDRYVGEYKTSRHSGKFVLQKYLPGQRLIEELWLN